MEGSSTPSGDEEDVVKAEETFLAVVVEGGTGETSAGGPRFCLHQIPSLPPKDRRLVLFFKSDDMTTSSLSSLFFPTFTSPSDDADETPGTRTSSICVFNDFASFLFQGKVVLRRSLDR